MDISARREAIGLALRNYRERGDKLTEPVEFRGKPEPLEVVRLPIEVPLLNHDNSRLGAMLANHPDLDKVTADPSSFESQEILASLLRRTEKYQDLKDELKELGQKRPGVITHDGMLVNGNTRLVALRELGVTAIEVAVLPIDASANDFFDVEMGLQLRKLLEQDYTFPAQLLLIKKLTRRFDSNEAIFKALGWKRSGEQRLAQHLRWLDLIEEIRSVGGQDYEFFDNKKELISNLDDTYQQLLVQDPVAAEELKWTRIFALTNGLNKDEIREIGPDFLEEHVLPKLGDEAITRVFGQSSGALETELDELIGDVSGSGVKFDMKQATKALAELPQDDESRGSVHRIFKLGARNIREDRVKEQMLQQPLEYLAEITEKVEQLSKNLAEYVKEPDFNSGKFEYQANKMIKAIKELDQLLKRHFSSN